MSVGCVMKGLYKKIREWISFKKSFVSEKNGTIFVSRFFGSVEMVVGHCFQSGPYIDRLFRKLLRFIPKDHAPKDVLLLGLGGGGAVREIKRRFPKAHIVAVEYDPVMVEIAQTIYLNPHDLESVEIVVGDARDPLSAFSKKYDVIFVDLFVGSSVSPLLETDLFLKQLVSSLHRDGYLAVNFYKQKKNISVLFDRFFSRWSDVRYASNKMAIYRNFGQGKIGDPVPDRFVDRQQSRIYLDVETIDDKDMEVIGEAGCLGLRSKHRWYSIDTYCSAKEPKPNVVSKARLVIWKPIEQIQKHGWMKNWFDDVSEQRGIGIITEQNKETYWKEWSSHARRHREKWLREEKYEIVPVQIEEFSEAFHASKKIEWLTRTGFIRVLKFRLKRHPENVRLFAARDKQTQEIIAGLAVIQYPDIRQSIHTVSFIHDKARHTSVGVGLIHHWYEQGIKEGIRYFNFGLVWKKGNPRAWKGYSIFKKQFNLYLVCYPKAVVKFFW